MQDQDMFLDITLKVLKMTNFMAYKEEELDFHNRDITGILAQYANDKTRSNRSGKTVILESIRYALTGKSRAKTDRELIHFGEKHMIVECVFTDGNNDYVIRRGVDAKGKGILELNWITNVKEAQTEINKLFGITPDDFDLTSFFKQADITGFMGMKPAEKTAFLMKYIENQHWTKKEAAANADRLVVKQKIRDNDNLRATLESGLELDMSLIGLRSDKLKEIEQHKESLKSLMEKNADITSKLRNIAENKKRIISDINKNKSNINELEKKMSDIEDATEDLERCKVNLTAVLKKIKETDSVREMSEISNNKARLLSKIELTKSKITSASKNAGICPIIKKECDSIKFSRDEVDEMKSEISALNKSIEELDNEANMSDVRREKIAEKERLKDKINSLSKKAVGIDRVISDIEKETDLLSANKNKLNELNVNELSEKQENIEDKIARLEHLINSIQRDVNKLDARIQSAKQAKEKIDRISNDNEKLRDELSLLNYTCYMFSKKGIPAVEIENAFGEIEEKINYCLEQLNAGLTISFSADKETTEKEPICSCGFEFPKGFKGKDCTDCGMPRQFKRKEEINFTVVEGDKEQSFELDSGGGRQIIAYAVKIALTYFKRRMNKCRLNMLFLDEIDSALDPYLADQIVSSVTNFLTKKLGFKQIIMVSHKEQIKNSMNHMIKVTKYEKHSTARFV